MTSSYILPESNKLVYIVRIYSNTEKSRDVHGPPLQYGAALSGLAMSTLAILLLCDTLQKRQILYRKTAYSLSIVVLADAQKLQKLNVINYKLNKHETHALAYTFKDGSWQI